MNKGKFLDKYDKDFVNLMIEIQNRIEDCSKINKLKINSWAKSLCLPTNNITWKKNRNLYAVKLLDNILNGKLEKPFTQFADDGEKLPMLDPILVKSQLTNKVKEVLSNGHPDVQIQNFINSNFQLIEPNVYDNFSVNTNSNNNNYTVNSLINNSPPMLNKAKTPTRLNINNNFNKKTEKNNNKNMNKKNNNIYYKINKTTGNKNNRINSDDEYYEDNSYNTDNYEGKRNDIYNEKFHKGDQLLKKNYFNYNEKLSKEPGFYMKTNPNSFAAEKCKLQSTIIFLENEAKIKNQIINQQDNDIQQLKKRVAELEKKVKIIFSK